MLRYSRSMLTVCCPLLQDRALRLAEGSTDNSANEYEVIVEVSVVIRQAETITTVEDSTAP